MNDKNPIFICYAFFVRSFLTINPKKNSRDAQNGHKVMVKVATNQIIKTLKIHVFPLFDNNISFLDEPNAIILEYMVNGSLDNFLQVRIYFLVTVVVKTSCLVAGFSI